MLAKVKVATPECSHWAMQIVSIRLVVYTHAFPIILLVVQLKSRAIGRCNEVVQGISWETP
jgi:hypothetical protein